jgi:hypothetical protein
MPLEVQLAHQFEDLCRRLSELATAQQWELPLAYWAVPKDRRLPKALLGHSLRQIVHMPFAKLRATPGIGIKKLTTLIELLQRVAATAGSESTVPLPPPATPFPATSLGSPEGADFDAAAVSEPQWAQWRDAVKRHGLAGERLGRFARSLQDLPGVLWHTPLSDYVDLTLEELRQLKTHGEKRVRAVIEVFAGLQSLLGEQPQNHLSVRIAPGFAAPVEAWLREAGGRTTFPTAAEVQREFVDPVLEQLRHDAGQTVAELAAGRLRSGPQDFNVRSMADELRLTRARVYQLLAEASHVMSVRWPDGDTIVQSLHDKALRERSSSEGTRLFIRAVDLFYPRRASQGAPQGSQAMHERQRHGNESQDEDQLVQASPRPPGKTRKSQAPKGTPKEKTQKPGSSKKVSLPGCGEYASDGFPALIDTSTCCPK